MMIRMVVGWRFLLVIALPGSPGQRAVKRLCVCVCVWVCVFIISECRTSKNADSWEKQASHPWPYYKGHERHVLLRPPGFIMSWMLFSNSLSRLMSPVRQSSAELSVATSIFKRRFAASSIFSIWLLFEFIFSVSVLFLASDLQMPPASGGFAPLIPWPGALPLDPTGGSAPDPSYKLALACTPQLRHLLDATFTTDHPTHDLPPLTATESTASLPHPEQTFDIPVVLGKYEQTANNQA